MGLDLGGGAKIILTVVFANRSERRTVRGPGREGELNGTGQKGVPFRYCYRLFARFCAMFVKILQIFENKNRKVPKNSRESL